MPEISDAAALTEGQVLRAVYASGLHQAAPGVLHTRWKDGIDVNSPSLALMNFVSKLLAHNVEGENHGN